MTGPQTSNSRADGGDTADASRAGLHPIDDAQVKRVTRWLGVYLLVATLITLTSAISIWPGVEQATDADQGVEGATDSQPGEGGLSVSILPWVQVNTTPGQAVIVFAAMMGGVGGGLAGLRALSSHRSRNDFDVNYAWWYVIRPLIGAGLAVVVYMVVRAGMIGAAPTEVINAFGVGGVAALSGLFAQNVLQQLNRVIEVLFGTAPSNSQTPDA